MPEVTCPNCYGSFDADDDKDWDAPPWEEQCPECDARVLVEIVEVDHIYKCDCDMLEEQDEGFVPKDWGDDAEETAGD